MDQRRDHKENLKILWDKQNWKHDIPKLRAMLRQIFIAIKPLLKGKKKFKSIILSSTLKY